MNITLRLINSVTNSGNVVGVGGKNTYLKLLVTKTKDIYIISKIIILIKLCTSSENDQNRQKLINNNFKVQNINTDRHQTV